MKISPVYGQLWRVAWPILVSLVMEHMISLTDTAFLGRYGEVELGASAVAGVFYLAVLMLGYGFSTGAQILIGRRNGEGRYGEIGPLLMQGCLFITAVSLVVVAATFVFAPFILRGVVSSPAIADAAVDYMNWRIFGLVFACVAFMYRGFYVGITETRILTLNSCIMVSVNVVLNYLLIFGEYGFPRMGIAGAALASTLSEGVAMVFFMVHTRLRIDRDRYGLHRVGFKAFHLVRSMVSVSVWTMAQHFVGISVWFIFFIAVEHLGGRAIAISTMVRSFGSLMCMPLFAFASAASTLISNQIGAGRPDTVISTALRATGLCYLCLLPPMLVVAVSPEWILRIYTDNTELMEQAVPSLQVIASAFILASPSCVLFNAVSGTGNTRHAMYIDFLAFFVYTAYVYVMIFTLRVDVALSWTSEHMYWLPLLLTSIVYFRMGWWRGKKI